MGYAKDQKRLVKRRKKWSGEGALHKKNSWRTYIYKYLESKRYEWKEYLTKVSDWEVSKYPSLN